MKMIALRFLLCGFAAMLVFSTPARAFEICETRCADYREGKCVREEQRCHEESPPQPMYGAIAYGRKSGAYGYSHGWSSRNKAESVALENCARHGGDCEPMLWFDRKCGAVVAPSSGTKAYWGYGDGVGQARAEALRQCEKDGGRQCQVKISHCSR